MKRFKKILIFTLSLIMVLSLLAGCSSKGSTPNTAVSEDRAVGSAPGAPMPSPVPEESESQDYGIIPPATSPLEPKKVITTIHLSFETTEFEKSNEELNKLIEKYKAYVENSNISYNHYYNEKMYRYGEFTIRVPKENIISFKTELNLIGHLVSENTNKQDVTKQYQDTESRLKVITVKEERILALLEKAEKIEDIITLEKELSEIIYEKENLKTSLMNLDDKIDFSTIYISLQEVQKISDTETIDTTFGTRIKNAFKNSLYSFKRGVENLIITFIYNIPFLIVVAVMLYIAYRLFRKRKNNNDKNDRIE